MCAPGSINPTSLSFPISLPVCSSIPILSFASLAVDLHGPAGRAPLCWNQEDAVWGVGGLSFEIKRTRVGQLDIRSRKRADDERHDRP